MSHPGQAHGALSNRKIFLSIKYHADLRNRALIEALSAVLAQAGWQTVCIIRDVEEWGGRTFSAPELMKRTFSEIDSSDMVIVEATEKGVGVGIEAGYACARRIPVIVIAQKGTEISTTLTGIASSQIEYLDPNDLLPQLSAYSG